MSAVAEGPAAALVAGGGGSQAGALAITGLSMRFAGGIESLDSLHSALASTAELQTVGPFPRWDTGINSCCLQGLLHMHAVQYTTRHAAALTLRTLKTHYLVHHLPPADVHYSPAGGIGKIASRFGTFVHSTFQFDPEAFGLSGMWADLLLHALLQHWHLLSSQDGKMQSLTVPYSTVPAPPPLQ